VLTISSSRAAGSEAADDSGPRLAELAARLGAEDVAEDLVADDRAAIEARLRHWCDEERCALVLTSGGTGLTADDVTPEATRAVLDREIPGIGEAIRLASREHTENWMLSRALAGTRGGCLIVNLPGSPRAVAQLAGPLEPGLRHALALIAGSHDGMRAGSGVDGAHTHRS
jgi:molybdenum cofactor synthesis domain-containing protein